MVSIVAFLLSPTASAWIGHAGFEVGRAAPRLKIASLGRVLFLYVVSAFRRT